jgi:hypothetical protein
MHHILFSGYRCLHLCFLNQQQKRNFFMAQDQGFLAASNKLIGGNTTRLVFAADGQQAADKSPFYIVSGVGDLAAKALPAGLSLSGDFPSVAAWQDYAENVPLSIASIRMETSDTDNWENTVLLLGERNPDGSKPNPRKLYMTDYQVSSGNGMKKSVVIPAEVLNNFVLTPQAYIQFQGIKKGTTITIYLSIGFMQRTIIMQPADF